MRHTVKLLGRKDWDPTAESFELPTTGLIKDYDQTGPTKSREKADSGEPLFDWIISNEGVDRDKDVISLKGWELANFRKNPVVPFGHDTWTLPVGKSHKVWRDRADGRKNLMSRVEFTPRDVSEFGHTVRLMVEGGFLKAMSVGFRVLEWSWEEDDEDRKGGINFTRNELLEHSVVPVPANADALIQAGAKIDLKLLKGWASRILDEGFDPQKHGLVRDKYEEAYLAYKGGPQCYVEIGESGILVADDLKAAIEAEEKDAGESDPLELFTKNGLGRSFAEQAFKAFNDKYGEGNWEVDKDGELVKAPITAVVRAQFSRSFSPSNVNGGKGWTQELSKGWLSEHSLKTPDPEITDGHFTYEQFDAGDCKSQPMPFIEDGASGPTSTGIELETCLVQLSAQIPDGGGAFWVHCEETDDQRGAWEVRTYENKEAPPFIINKADAPDFIGFEEAVTPAVAIYVEDDGIVIQRAGFKQIKVSCLDDETVTFRVGPTGQLEYEASTKEGSEDEADDGFDLADDGSFEIDDAEGDAEDGIDLDGDGKGLRELIAETVREMIADKDAQNRNEKP